MLFEGILVVDLNTVTEHNWVRFLHHSGFQVKRKKDIVLFSTSHFRLKESLEFLSTHKRRIYHLIGKQRLTGFEDSNFTRGGNMFNLHISIFRDNNTLFVAVEVTFAHMRNVGFSLFAPGLHGVRVFLCILLYSISNTPI